MKSTAFKKAGKIKLNRIFTALKSVSLILSLCMVITLFSGCNFDSIGSMLSPPSPGGENLEIQQALEKYIKDNRKDGSLKDFKLKYPQSGSERASFVINPMTGTEAVAFYQIGSSSNARINLLKKSDKGWTSVGDKEGASSDIDRIKYLDINGDGLLEIAVGWSLSAKDNRLYIYSSSDGTFKDWAIDFYQEMIVDTFTGDGKDNIITLYPRKIDDYTDVTLWSANTEKDENGINSMKISSIGRVSIENSVQQFGKNFIVEHSLYGKVLIIDGFLSMGTTTELFYWDKDRGELIAPFHQDGLSTNTISFRESNVPLMDIDADGRMEWPITSKILSVEKDENTKVYYTDWFNWSLADKERSLKTRGIVNMEDHYFLAFDDLDLDVPWKNNLLIEYKTAEKELIVSTHGEYGERYELLVIRSTFNHPFKSDAAEEEPQTTASGNVKNFSDKNMTSLLTLEDRTYEVWFTEKAPTNFNIEKIKRLFVNLDDIVGYR